MTTSRVNANADLLWFYSVGAETAEGDMGLRSSLGSQLQAMQEGRVSSHGVNISEIEDNAIERCKHATRYENIVRRLRQLSRRQNEQLEAHFKGRGLPYGISSVAVYCEHARVMCGTRKRPATEKLREELMKRKTAKHRDVEGLDWEAKRLVKDLLDVYASTEIERAVPIQDVRQGRERTNREAGRV